MGGVPVASAVLSLDAPVRPSDALRAWLLAYVGLSGFTLATALLVAVLPGGPVLARGLLHLTLTATHNPPPSLAGVLAIAANNTLRSLWPLSLGLIDAQRHRATRTLADMLVSANLLVPGLLVGACLAAYGTRTLPYLPHAPLEFAGIAVGASGWLHERDHSLTPRDRLRYGGAAVLLLLVGATIETYLVPHT